MNEWIWQDRVGLFRCDSGVGRVERLPSGAWEWEAGMVRGQEPGRFDAIERVRKALGVKDDEPPARPEERVKLECYACGTVGDYIVPPLGSTYMFVCTCGSSDLGEEGHEERSRANRALAAKLAAE